MNFIIPNNNLQLNKPYHKILNRHDGIYVDHPVSLMFFNNCGFAKNST